MVVYWDDVLNRTSRITEIKNMIIIYD